MTARPVSAAQLVSMGVRGVSMTGDTDAPALEISRRFLIQSYINNTLQHEAILEQSPTEAIVRSTNKTVDLGGYAVALHPASEAPIAIQFRAGQQNGSSGTFRLKPGQFLRPFGAPGGKSGRFSGFNWGLPFGWLGGGNVNLIVFRTSDASVGWTEQHEILFHRMRVPIRPLVTVPLFSAASYYNWPTRFPWPHAIRTNAATNSFNQAGQPILSVKPTRTVMRLVKPLAVFPGMPAPATMRAYFLQPDVFGTDLNGSPDAQYAADGVMGVDVVWPQWNNVASAQYAVQTPVQIFRDDEFSLLAANDGGVYFVDASGGDLTEFSVDVARYGTL